jgi:hypothetical protein
MPADDVICMVVASSEATRAAGIASPLTEIDQISEEGIANALPTSGRFLHLPPFVAAFAFSGDATLTGKTCASSVDETHISIAYAS